MNRWLRLARSAFEHSPALEALVLQEPMCQGLQCFAKLNGHDPYAYLKDVLTRLPTHKNSQIEELLPHRWQPGRP